MNIIYKKKIVYKKIYIYVFHNKFKILFIIIINNVRNQIINTINK